MRHTRCVAQLHSSSAFLGCVGEIDRALDNALRPTPRKTSPLPLLFTDDCLHIVLFSARNFQRSDDVSVAQLVAIRDTVSMPYPGDAALLIVPQTIDDGSHSIRRIASSVLGSAANASSSARSCSSSLTYQAAAASVCQDNNL